MNTKKKCMVLVFALILSAFQGITYGTQTNNKISFYDVFSANTLTNNLRQQINLNSFMIKDLSIQSEREVPKILIIHSHTHENYEINKETKQIGSVVDVGNELKKVLGKNYKVSVLHDKGEYDTVNGKVYVAGAYDRMEIEVKKILQENPSIEVIIDIHRDGGIEPSATLINEVSTAKINIINGLNMNESIGKIGSLKQYPNPYIQDNLSFSIQMKCKSDELSPELISKVKINKFRYSLHMRPKSLLIDIGNNKDTLEAAINSIKPFSKVLADVLGLENIK